MSSACHTYRQVLRDREQCDERYPWIKWKRATSVKNVVQKQRAKRVKLLDRRVETVGGWKKRTTTTPRLRLQEDGDDEEDEGRRGV
jgi:hypothetical protein